MVALPVSLNYAMSRGDPDEQFPICEQESFQNSLLSSASAVVSPVSLTSFVFHLGDAEFYVMHERENCLATRLDEHRREYHGSSRRRHLSKLISTLMHSARQPALYDESPSGRCKLFTGTTRDGNVYGRLLYSPEP